MPLFACHLQQVFGRLKLWNVGGFGVAVEGACLLTAVAAVDVGTKLISQLGVYGAAVLNALVRETALGVENWELGIEN